MMGDRMNKDSAPMEQEGNSEHSTDYELNHHLQLSGVLDKQTYSAIRDGDCTLLDSRADLSLADAPSAKKRQKVDVLESSAKRQNASLRRDDAIGGKDPPTSNRTAGSPTAEGLSQTDTSFDLSGAAQLNILYQQQAALLNESRRLVQQNAAHQALLQQNQNSLAVSDMSGFLSHPPRPLWGNTGPGMWLNQGLLPSSSAGSHVANQLSILAGGGSGWDSNLIGSTALGTTETALARFQQQFPIAALAGGTTMTASNISDQSGSMHASFSATRGRQPFIMSPQAQFLGGMSGFAMPDASTGFAHDGGFMGGLQVTTGVGARRNVEGLSVGDAVSSSMTPAGIPHQDLYAQDVFPKTDDESESNVLLLYIQSCDDNNLSAYQCLVRKQIELFEAKLEDVESNAQGRNKPIVSGQVGIRCRHCSRIPPRHRTRGATYYPAKLRGLYQAAQNMASAHLSNHCQLIPDILRQELILLRDRKSSAGGGKQYWADGVRVLGVIESNGTLRFDKRRDDRIQDNPEIKQVEFVEKSERCEGDIKEDGGEDNSTSS